jgi:hypothetical protein
LALALFLECSTTFQNGMNCSFIWSEELNANASTTSRLQRSYLPKIHNILFANAAFWAMLRSSLEVVDKYRVSCALMHGYNVRLIIAVSTPDMCSEYGPMLGNAVSSGNTWYGFPGKEHL